MTPHKRLNQPLVNTLDVHGNTVGCAPAWAMLPLLLPSPESFGNCSLASGSSQVDDSPGTRHDFIIAAKARVTGRVTGALF